MVTMEMTAPFIREGLDSGSSTLLTIWKLVQPMDWAASMTPASTSFREDSTIRAT